MFIEKHTRQNKQAPAGQHVYRKVIMHTQIKTNFLFYTFTLFIGLNSFFLSNTAAQVDESASDNYTFETIDVPDVDFLAVTASSDFEDYAGYTKSADGEKDVGFTLIDGVFTTYDFPGSQNTYFYALGNNGNAAGHYQDSNGLYHGAILENGELRQYDFPGAVETQIFGISDATGALTGNFIDASGVRRGFSGDTIVEYPEASATYAGFVNASGITVGSYVDAEGIYHAYVYPPDGRFVSFDIPEAGQLEYLFLHGINEVWTVIGRAKQVDDVPRTFISTFEGGLQEFQFPGSVSTEGWNINQDGSVVGYYDSADGRRHGFIAKPGAGVPDEPGVLLEDANYTFETIDIPGIDFLAVTASSDFEDYAGYTKSADGQKDIAFTLIDGVFTTYDFPGSQNTYFYALGNNGNAAGHYQDSDGLYHGVVLENGELRQYDFPGAVQTEIYGISDATGVLTGNFIDASGVRRGFSGDIIVEYPEASATYADFVNASGSLVGSYVDADGVYHAYIRNLGDRFISSDISNAENLEYFFLHGINDAMTIVSRAKRVDDVPRTYVGTLQRGSQELRFPDSVSTEGWNINQDGSVVGYYDSVDGRRHGFIARPTAETAAPVEDPSLVSSVSDNYTFETIDIPGVDFLAVTASSDFEDYAGYTKSADGQKDVAFTLIDGVFMTYDFPGSQNTYFYALGNNGNAAGHYQDSDGLYHGVILENGELRQYDFPGAVQTEIYGISDATGNLTGNFIDASGVRRGFSGDTIIEVPGASETYADFVNASGALVGSYVDADGTYNLYIRTPDGRFRSNFAFSAEEWEYIFIHGINDARVIVGRSKTEGDVPRTFVGILEEGTDEFRFPGSVSTEGWNINQDGSIVGHYDSANGRRHGFIARPTEALVEQIYNVPIVGSTRSDYIFESIDVPGVDFLEVTASSDFADYAGNTRSPDGEKIVGFTLIDGVFMTYDFPGSQNTYFSALGNSGQAAGHYQDSNGLHHGVVLENGELRQYDFPGAVETQIFGISDATGNLTGNFIDASGVRRGFSGETIIEYPGASATYAYFANKIGILVGSYIDADGVHHPYIRTPVDTLESLKFPIKYEYFIVRDLNEAGTLVVHRKTEGDVPRTYAGSFFAGSFVLDTSTSLEFETFFASHELRFPGSVRTEGWNVNPDGSIVGHYDSADGRRHGFIARPANKVRSDYFGNVYDVTLSKGLNMLSVPLAPPKPMTAKSLVAMTGATTIVALDAENQRFVAWTPGAPDDGFPIEGGKGYIVNVRETRNFAFVGSRWTNQTEKTAAAPSAISTGRSQQQAAWAFVVSGHLEGKPDFDGYQVSVRNLRTNSTITASVHADYFAAATADLARRSVVQVGDVIELRVIGPNGNAESQPFTFKVTPEHLANAVLPVRLEGIGRPQQDALLQNYPNPFNPETWIPYQLSEDSQVSISIYDTTGKLIRTLSLGYQSTGFYNSQGRAAYWDGRNALGERVASGLYFYQLTTPSFQQTRRLVIVK